MDTRKMVFVLLFFVSASTSLQAQSNGKLNNDDPIAVQLIEISNTFFEALKERNSTYLNKVIHDDFSLTSSDSNGEYLNKTMYVTGSMRPEIIEVHEFHLTDFVIRVYENTAIVQSRIDWKSMYRGKPWNANFLNTDVFIKEGSDWKVVHRHTSYPANQLTKVVKERYSGGGE